jgi:hypothetical protein
MTLPEPFVTVVFAAAAHNALSLFHVFKTMLGGCAFPPKNGGISASKSIWTHQRFSARPDNSSLNPVKENATIKDKKMLSPWKLGRPGLVIGR